MNSKYLKDNKYLKMARQAIEENNIEEALKFYDTAKTEDPDNVEAMFFYQYYTLIKWPEMSTLKQYNVVEELAYIIIKALGECDDTAEAKFDLLSRVVDAFLPLAATLRHYTLKLDNGVTEATRSKAEKLQNNHIKNAKGLGNAIIDTFGEEKGLYTDLAVKCWKEAIDFDFACCKYLNYKDKDKEVWMHKYEKKIQKYDPSYKMPEYKQVGCFAIGDAAKAQPRSED